MSRWHRRSRRHCWRSRLQPKGRTGRIRLKQPGGADSPVQGHGEAWTLSGARGGALIGVGESEIHQDKIGNCYAFPDSVGPFEIVAPIGAGGVGESYRVGDTKLDRVAIYFGQK